MKGDLEELPIEEIKGYCSQEMFARMEPVDIVEMFKYINRSILRLEGSTKLEDVIELKWWKNAFRVIDKEIKKRKMNLTYIGTTPGGEAELAIRLLQMGGEDAENAYTFLDKLQLPQLKRIEAGIKKVLSRDKDVFGPYLIRIRERIVNCKKSLN